MITGSIVILLMLQAFGAYAEDCPGDAERFKPCQCRNNKALGMTIACKDKDIAEIYQMFDRISPENLKLNVVYIKDDKATSLRANLFNGSTANQLMVRMGKLQSIDDNVFEGQDARLTLLHFVDTDMADIPTNIIKNLKNLKAFDFNNADKIRIVQANGFEGFSGIYSLKRIAYKKNSISYLEDNAFAYLKRIEVIDLTFNNLRYIDESSFPTRIPHTFLLAHNSLRDLSLDFLKALPHGTAIDLSANKVQYVPRQLLRTLIKKGIVISLDKNLINCGCNMMTMATANRNNLADKFEGSCSSPSQLKGRLLSNLTYEDFPNCKEESEDLVAVMEAGFNANMGTFVHLNENAEDKLESSSYEIYNSLKL